eukprot:4126145-Amphidinium_carterae.1
MQFSNNDFFALWPSPKSSHSRLSHMGGLLTVQFGRSLPWAVVLPRNTCLLLGASSDARAPSHHPRPLKQQWGHVCATLQLQHSRALREVNAAWPRVNWAPTHLFSPQRPQVSVLQAL